MACLIQWTGLDAVTPDEQAIAQFHSSGDTWTTASATPNDTGRWAATFTSYRTTNVADNAPSWTTTGLTQRQDLDTSAGLSPWVVALTTDSNGSVSFAAHDYTHVASVTNSSGVSLLMYLVAGGTNAAVTAAAATASVDGVSPTVAGTASVDVIEATATADAYEPTVLGELGGSPEVGSNAAEASAEAYAPTLTVEAYITAVPAEATASVEAPFAGVTVLIFSPPTRREHYGTKKRDPLGVRIGYPTGLTVLKERGFYTTLQVQEADDERIEAAEAAYLGGHDYVVTDAEAAALTTAGYGSNITSRPQ